jgi:hypothetical protein
MIGTMTGVTAAAVLVVVAVAGLAALAAGWLWTLRRLRRRSREVNAQVEALSRALSDLQAGLDAERAERGRLEERLAEIGRLERESAEVVRAMAEGGLEPASGARLLRHLGELAAEVATDRDPEP